MLRTLLRNSLPPLILAGLTFYSVIAFSKLDPHEVYLPEQLRGIYWALGYCLIGAGGLYALLEHFPRPGALTGFIIGAVISPWPGWLMGIALLAFSGDGGNEAARRSMNFTLPAIAFCTFITLGLGCFLGALIGNVISQRREEKKLKHEGH